MTLHVCYAPDFTYRRVLRCPACRRRRRIVLHDYTWWGAEKVCCHCGGRWCSDMGKRRQTRRQRAVAAEKARRDWTNARPKVEVDAAWREYMGYES